MEITWLFKRSNICPGSFYAGRVCWYKVRYSSSLYFDLPTTPSYFVVCISCRTLAVHVKINFSYPLAKLCLIFIGNSAVHLYQNINARTNKWLLSNSESKNVFANKCCTSLVVCAHKYLHLGEMFPYISSRSLVRLYRNEHLLHTLCGTAQCTMKSYL